MAIGENQDLQVNKPDGSTGKETHRLIYVQSTPFDGRYATTDATVTVASNFEILHALAFLKRDVPPEAKVAAGQATRWYKPTLRCMHSTNSDDHHTARAVLTDPDKGESAVFLIQVKL